MRGPNLQGWGEWSGDPCSAGICSYKGYRSSTRSLGLHLLLCPSWEATAWGQQPNQTCVWEDLSTGTPWAISGSESVLTAWATCEEILIHQCFPRKWPGDWFDLCHVNTHTHTHIYITSVPRIPITSTLIFVILNQSHHSEILWFSFFIWVWVPRTDVRALLCVCMYAHNG